MHVDRLEDILKEFLLVSESVKQLYRTIRSILFPLRQNGGLDTGTHTLAEELYSKVIKAYNGSLATLNIETDF